MIKLLVEYSAEEMLEAMDDRESIWVSSRKLSRQISVDKLRTYVRTINALYLKKNHKVLFKFVHQAHINKIVVTHRGIEQ